MRESQDSARTSWHALTADAVLKSLAASKHGLDAGEVDRRRARYGPNRLPEAKKRSAIERLLAQFNNLLILVLLAAAAVTAALGHWIDSAVILMVAVFNAIIGFVQEGKAERALDAIGRMLAPSALVVRDGRRITLPAEELVPGDIVQIEAGDLVPADLRVLQSRNLHAQEAVLTGESLAVEKGPDAVAAETLLGDRGSMAYSGTLITSGRGTGIVVATGAATEIGSIGTLLEKVEAVTTPLLRQMDQFARWLTFAILGAAAAMFVFGIFLRAIPAVEMFIVVVGLSVAAIPEGLPAILTVTLAIGVQRMAGRNAIIRRLPAVETLGAVSVICSDKTGTLTRNEMMVQAVVTADEDATISGDGYAPHGEVYIDGEAAAPEKQSLLLEMAQGAILCSDASLRRTEDGTWLVDGDPMEGALVAFAHKMGLDVEPLRRQYHRVDEIPFDAEHRFMATLHHNREDGAFVFLKGAPERVLELCACQRGHDATEPCDLAYWQRVIEETAARGMRVLAIARKDVPKQQRDLGFADCESGFVLLGLFGFIDPPRPEAIEAVAECRSAGIRVKMITGDHAATAAAIAASLGLENTGEVVTGIDIEALDRDALRELVSRVDVYARTSPEHKLRLVEALQANGLIVAMTGDGVNDAPALKRADIGIAMGRKGTEAARQAAEMVLADDNFASIAAAVREGRTVYDNLKKAILFLLPINGGEATTIIAAILLGYDLPITPLQILWVNMVSSVGLAMTLAFEPAEPDLMRRPPRPPRQPLLNRFLSWRILFVSLLFMIGTAGAFFAAVGAGLPIETARTIAVNTLVAMEIFYLFNVRYLAQPSLTFTGVRGTPAVLIAIAGVFALQIVFTYVPLMATVFETRPLSFVQGLAAVAIAIVAFAVLEIEKIARRSVQRDERWS